eukprot:2815819-Prymnesium_polylepis.1
MGDLYRVPTGGADRGGRRANEGKEAGTWELEPRAPVGRDRWEPPRRARRAGEAGAHKAQSQSKYRVLSTDWKLEPRGLQATMKAQGQARARPNGPFTNRR